MRCLFLLAILLLTACVSNTPFRAADSQCKGHIAGCGSHYIEGADYDMAFVEFTERGNEFDPELTSRVLNNIKDKASAGGVAIVVFVHGWKHNSSESDPHLLAFAKALEEVKEKKVVGDRKLIGLYVGWRGRSLAVPGLEHFTFWDRKATAEEVGRGGVGKVLLQLEAISKANDSNFMLTVGHSFGAAILVTALHDVMLERMLVAESGKPLIPFGDGVILINPAIEANQGLLLKESSMRLGAGGKKVPSMMHVISSRADVPTHFAFPLGQTVGVSLFWRQNVLDRTYLSLYSASDIQASSYPKKGYKLREKDLDEETIGNYPLYTTGYMEDVREEEIEEPSDGTIAPFALPGMRLRNPDGGRWLYTSFCAPQHWNDQRLPCTDRDPIDFMSMPKSFINDHNDVFNGKVKALLSAIVQQYAWAKIDPRFRNQACSESGDVFSFTSCFASYLTLFSGSEN